MIKKLLSIAASITMLMIGASAQSPTAPALGFNAFLQNNATLTTNESEGPIAIGGDLTVAGNYQVNIHNNGTFAVSSVPIGLFVGGKVNLSSGSLQVNSGRYVKIGNCSGSNIKTWYRDNNNASSNIYITGSSASYASTPNININSNAFAWGTEVSASNNPICDANTSSQIDFSTAFNTMKATATSMAACSSSGNILSNPNQNVFGSTISSVLTGGQVKITLASGTNVLNVSGSDLNSVTNGITFTNSPDASHVLVINVNASGSFTWNVWNQAGISGNNAPYIIYNFYNASSINIAGNSTIEGTVFAPNADITKTVNQANIEGQIIGKSFSQNGGELHYYPFTPSVTGCAVASSVCSGFTTYTQGGWGAEPKGNNPGTILQNNFAAVYPSGVTIGCSSGYTLRFTSSSAITAFLPQGGSPSAISASATNPTGSLTVLAGQVLAAQLNVDFDKYSPSGYKTNTSALLSTLVYNSGTFKGKTVQFVLDEANKVLGGCSSSYSASDLNDAITKLNENYDNGGGTNIGNLDCGSSATPVASITGSSSVCQGNSTTLADATAGGTWSSSDNTIATVTSGGVVTGVKGGTVTITYSVSGYSPSATMSFTVKATSTSTTNASICDGGSYTFNGTSYSTAGTYTAHLTNAAGCDSAASLVLTVKAKTTSSTPVSVCSLPYVWNGTSYNAAGSYTIHLTNAAGCDSAATLVLTKKSSSTSTTNASICDGGSYTFNGTSYSTAGTYTAHLTNAAGCDSAASLVLTVKAKTTSSTAVSVCSLPYVWNGTSYNATGSYTIHLTNAVGCDSAATLVLTKKSASTSTTNASICDGGSYTFNGTSYSAAGTYTAHLTSAAGCDSAASLVLTVKAKTTSSTAVSVCSLPYVWNGTSYNAAGSYTIHLANAAGCDSAATLVLTKKSSSTSTTTASICDGGSYTFNGTSYSAAGTYTAHLTNAAGCDSAASLVLTVNPSPAVAPIVGTDTICATTTTSLSEATLGGVWASSDNNVATVDASGTVTAIADGKANITYTVINSGCSAVATLPFVVSCDTGSVTSGGTGGLESKPLGAAIGTRNFNLYKSGQNGAVQYTAAEQIVAPKKGSIATFGITAKTLYSVMPYQVNSAYTAYDKSAAVADLTSITNAIDVRTIDFTLNNSPKAVAFATKTVGGIYSHTKPICDRLKGAQLLNIENVQIASHSFIRYTILQADGSKEYAVSFSAGQKAGRSTYSLQSNWLMPDYVSEDTMINYQLWASTPTDVTTMVKEILNRLQATMPVSELSNGNDLPCAYVSAANRKGANLNLTINNRTANTSGYFTLTQHATENTTIDNKVIVPFTIGANGRSTVSIPVGDTYDANISMVFNNTTTDMLYIADGIWGTSGDNNTSVAQFNVANNNSRVASTDEYALLRDVKVQVTTPSYVSVYKYLRGGASAVNLSGYKSFKFTANTNTEGLNMKITITKEGVNNWKSQYTYYITGLQDGQTYQIGTSEFKSTDNGLPATMDLSDVTSVVYNIENPTGQTISFNAGISNAAFSKVDIAYERSLQAKAVGISPNPSNGNFKVSFASPAAAQLQLTIIDNLGRVVSTKQVNATQGNNTVSVSLNETMKKGLYFVSLQGAGTRYDTQKVMFQGK